MNLRSGRMLLPPSIPQPADWPTIDYVLDRIDHIITSEDAKEYIIRIIRDNTHTTPYNKHLIILSTIELIRRFNLDTNTFWFSIYQRMLNQIENVPHLVNF